MANFLHRTTKQYLTSTSPNGLPESNAVQDYKDEINTGAAD